MAQAGDQGRPAVGDGTVIRHVGFLVFPGFQLLDLSGPLAAFEIAATLAPGLPYRMSVLSERGGAVASSAGIEVLTQCAAGDLVFDTFFVVGGAACRDPRAASGLVHIARQYGRGARRMASVCTGAFVLAAAGMLHGREATTHWRHAATLQKLFGHVRVNAESLVVRDGPVWTSAGANAGIDLALAMIEQDFGIELARSAARHMVVHRRRLHGQSRFVGLLDVEPESERIRRALDFARQRLHEPLPVDRLAEVACLSPRQFGRIFIAEVGFPPAHAIERLRVEAARLRIESGREPMAVIARQVGFMDTERMRRAFVRLLGTPPQAIRRTVRQA